MRHHALRLPSASLLFLLVFPSPGGSLTGARFLLLKPWNVPSTTLFSSGKEDDKGDGTTPEEPNGGGGIGSSTTGGVVLQSDFLDRTSLLESAFAALDETDQYDAVLTGLCAKILDGEASSTPVEGEEVVVGTMSKTKKAFRTLKDPIRLLGEMNGRGVTASGRSMMALVDATARTEDPRAMSTVLSLCTRNGAIAQYGSLQGTITPFPPVPASRVRCPDGKTRTRAERIEVLPTIPTDDRASEVASALAVSLVVGGCLFINSFGSTFGLEDWSPYTSLLVAGVFTLGVVDNFYDVIKVAGNLAAKSAEDNIPEPVKKLEMPEKEGMPFGLGTGEITGSVVRGLTRLLSVDTERECQCEAAAFFAAYSLGLPCFAFRPNALEAAVLVFESMKDLTEGEIATESGVSNALDPLLSDAGVLKVLVWLMAPVAMESSKYPQLITSDPREGSGLLERLREKLDGGEASSDDWGGLMLSGTDGEKEDDDMLRWAYAEADLLLRSNSQVCDELSERLASGAATVGDCVAVLEGW